MSDREKSVILVSGGINSTVAASHAVAHSDCHLLYCDHGHPAAAAEIRCVRALAEAFAADLHLVKLPSADDFTAVGPARENASRRGDADRTAGSNGVGPRGVMLTLLGVARQLADRVNAQTIVCGASQLCNEADRGAERGQGDPDLRQLFFHAAGTALQLSLPPKRKVALDLPFVQMSRTDVVRAGLRIGTPFHLTWSCHAGGELPCGQCAGCKSRTAAFEAAGMPDPLLEPAR